MSDERINIDGIARTLTSLVGTERFAGRDDDGDFKATISAIASLLEDRFEPVGTIKPFDKSFPNTPALSEYYVENDGAVISDSDSVYDGYRSRLLNNGSIAFSVVWSSGVATLAATDVSALLVGHAVSGGAIAAGAYITDITGNVVTISDTAISATVTTTFTDTNGGRYLRGASTSGAGSLDAMQRVVGSFEASGLVATVVAPTGSGALQPGTSTARTIANSTGSTTTADIDFDNSASGTYKTDGTGTGDGETSVLDMTVVWITRIK